MATTTDLWAVTPGSDADFYVTTVTPAGAGALTLANTQPEYNGCAYKVSITSVDDETGKNFVITGVGVDGNALTETKAGGNNTTVYTTNYFVSVSSITVSAATTDAITIGYGGDMHLPKTRIRSLYYVAAGSAGSIVVTRASNSRVLLNVVTAGDSSANGIYIPADGILTAFAVDDYATVAITSTTSVTLFCG